MLLPRPREASERGGDTTEPGPVASIRARIGQRCLRCKQKGCRSTLPVQMARPERFELPTTKFVAWYSIQLSYGRTETFVAPPTARPPSLAQAAADALGEERAIILIDAARVNPFLHEAGEKGCRRLAACGGYARQRRGGRACCLRARRKPAGAASPVPASRTTLCTRRRSVPADDDGKTRPARSGASLRLSRSACGEPVEPAGSPPCTLRRKSKTPHEGRMPFGGERDGSARSEPRPCALRAPGQPAAVPIRLRRIGRTGRFFRAGRFSTLHAPPEKQNAPRGENAVRRREGWLGSFRASPLRAARSGASLRLSRSACGESVEPAGSFEPAGSPPCTLRRKSKTPHEGAFCFSGGERGIRTLDRAFDPILP